MDSQTSSGLGIVAIIVSVGTTIVGIINHKRLRSKCCGRKIELEVDIESTKSGIIVPTNSPLPKNSELVIRVEDAK